MVDGINSVTRNKGQEIPIPIHPADVGKTISRLVGERPHLDREWRKPEAGRLGQFLLDEGPVSGHERLRADSRLIFFRSPWVEPEIPTDVPVVYENKNLLLVDKPAGIPITPTGAYHDHTLLHLLRKRTGIVELSPVHRLDLETSGLIAFAKTPASRGFYQKQFQHGQVEKRYTALVFGHVDPDLRQIDDPLDRDTLIHTKYVPDPDGRPALTRILEIDHWETTSLLTLSPVTGRTNQLRAHLAGIGHPIVGDKKYYPDTSVFFDWLEYRDVSRLIGKLKLRRQALHCKALAFVSETGKNKSVFRSIRDVSLDWQERLVLLLNGANLEYCKK